MLGPNSNGCVWLSSPFSSSHFGIILAFQGCLHNAVFRCTPAKGGLDRVCCEVLTMFVLVCCGREPKAALENYRGRVGGAHPQESMRVRYTINKVGGECLCWFP